MLQAKVLRAVEQGEVQPLGSNEPPDRVDVRLICATNRDLEADGEDRRVPRRPVLPAQRDDARAAAAAQLQGQPRGPRERVPRAVRRARTASRRRGSAPTCSRGSQAYDFPGNVRELKNTIEHAVILCTRRRARVEDLPKPLQDSRARRTARAHRTPQLTLDEARETLARPARAPVPDRPAREARRQRQGRREGRGHQHGDAVSPAQAARPAHGPHRRSRARGDRSGRPTAGTRPAFP